MISSFNWRKFTKKIAIEASIQAVYDAWTVPQVLEQWFLSKAVFFDNRQPVSAVANIDTGHEYEWQWFAQETSETGTVLEANGSDLLSFTFAGNCKVDVKMYEEEGYTIIELTQKDIPDDEKSRVSIWLDCAFGWAFYLVNLKAFLEHRVDLRHKDKKINKVVNG
ncbi:MAG TPA: SRPBCC domain-containing protein [Flavisolibacter sp.]|jgi:hypothetical protein